MREVSPKRKFEQSVELSMTLEGIDPKKPEGRITEDVILPHRVGAPKKILVFAEGELARRAREAGADLVLSRVDVEALGRDRKKVKRLAAEHDFFIAQADMMVLIGRAIGSVLGPRGKMPRPIPSTADPAPVIERLKRTVRLATKDQRALHVRIGVESMRDEEIAENARAVLDAVEHKIRESGGSVAAVRIKTTMGKPVKLEA
jgi:large subunit ribosomal protein L1